MLNIQQLRETSSYLEAFVARQATFEALRSFKSPASDIAAEINRSFYEWAGQAYTLPAPGANRRDAADCAECLGDILGHLAAFAEEVDIGHLCSEPYQPGWLHGKTTVVGRWANDFPDAALLLFEYGARADKYHGYCDLLHPIIHRHLPLFHAMVAAGGNPNSVVGAHDTPLAAYLGTYRLPDASIEEKAMVEAFDAAVAHWNATKYTPGLGS